MIDFPIMCFVNTNNLGNILEVHNLADKDKPRLSFNLDDCRFENFLRLNLLQAESRIAFLATNMLDGNLSVVLLRFDKPFEKTTGNDLGKLCIQKFNLKKNKGLKEYLNHIFEAFMLETDSQDSLLRDKSCGPSLLFATKSSIYLSQDSECTDLRENVGRDNKELANIKLL